MEGPLRACWMLGLAAAFVAGCGDGDGAGGGRKGGEWVVTVSGEGLGVSGYAFPPRPGQSVFFVDGWDLRFERILVVVDNIRFAEMPDQSPGNQGETGQEVARRTGPWVVDLNKPGTDMDKGGAGKTAIRLPIDDLSGVFDLDERYAFSYDLAVASSSAKLVNVDSSDADYQEMVSRGARVLAIGKASFKGNASECRASKDDYDWAKIPQEVRFRFLFEGPVSYVNCQNPDNTGQPIEGEESQRGVQAYPNGPTVAQLTIHTDHFFWTKTTHGDTPMFNQFAANAKEVGGEWVVDLETLESVALAPVTDASKGVLPWRSCVAETFYKLPSVPSEMTFETMGQPLTSLHDFVQFNASTMGHLNADGICYVAGHTTEHDHP